MQFDEAKIYSTLGERSKADDGQGFIESNQIVYDFDEITKEIADIYRNNRPVASCDALYVKDKKHIYLFEFKNARRSRIGKNFFAQKAYDSAMTLLFAFYQNISLEELRDCLYLIVVYNDENVVEKEQESAYFEAFKKSVGCLAGSRNIILFHLDTYKGTLYKEVITVDKDYFMEQIYPQIFEI